MTGDLDYNGAVSGVISAAVQDRPVRCLIFTVARPLVFLFSKKEIREARDLKGRKIAGSTPGASHGRDAGGPFRRARIRRRRRSALVRAGEFFCEGEGLQ
jgi:hypothetical protein